LDNAVIALAAWLVSESSPLFAGFLGGVLAQVVVLLSSRGKNGPDRAVRIQITLIWIVIGALLLVNINQGQNIQKLLEAR